MKKAIRSIPKALRNRLVIFMLPLPEIQIGGTMYIC